MSQGSSLFVDADSRSTRRDFVKAVGAVAVSPMLLQALRPVVARGSGLDVLTVVSHQVHQQVITGTRGGAAIDLMTPFLKEHGISRADWITLGIQAVHDRLFREASLPSTQVDMGLVLNSYVSPRVANLFEPLTEYQERHPIEDIEDFFAPMRQTFTHDGHLFAVPMRATTTTLHFNEEVVEKQGLSGPPRSMEEFDEYVRKLTHTLPNGERVYGFGMQGAQSEIYLPLLDLARAWGDGDYITSDYDVVCNGPAMVKALTFVRDWLREGYMPPNLNAVNNTDNVRMVQNGRVAMTVNGSNYYWTYNDPENSAVAGKMGIANLPVSESLRGRYEVAPTKTEFWAFSIPRNARFKDVSWELIRYLSSKKNTLTIALNGNGPTRASTYDSAEYQADIPYAALEQKVLEVSRPPFPLIEDTSRIVDVIGQQAHLALAGVKSPQAAMDDAAAQISRLL